MSSRYHAHRDNDDWPMVSTDDWRALFWLICFAVLFVAICAVEGPQ